MAQTQYVDEWTREHAGPAMTKGQADWWARRINRETPLTATVQTVEERGLVRYGWTSGYVVLVEGRIGLRAITLCTSQQASLEFRWFPKKAV